MRAIRPLLVPVLFLSAVACGGDDSQAEPDAGPIDASPAPRDGAAIDASAIDAAAIDAAAIDAAAIDAAAIDASAIDASAIDASAIDASAIDASAIDAPASADAGVECPVAGRWRLVSIFCADMDITADWLAVVPSTIAVYSTGPSGLCHLVVTHSSPSCSETQELDVEPDGTATSVGITACDPPGCTFAPTDAPCAIGDRAGSSRGSASRDGARLTVTFAAAEGAGFCSRYGLSTTETYALE